MRISAKYAFILLAIVVIIGEMSKTPESGGGAPRPFPSEQGLPPLADKGPEGKGVIGPGRSSDDVIVIEEEERQSRSQYTGTAFSIDGGGLWVTARHVTNNCDKLLLARPFQRPLRIEAVAQHKNADVSLFQTNQGYAALDIDDSSPVYNQEGFHFGFPRGEPGAVYSRLIGRRTMKTTGANRYKETVHVWAEKIRVPDSDKSLGGISGGPILNKQGSVVGIHVAGSIRRGRSFSSLPSHITELLNDSNVELAPAVKLSELNALNSNEFAGVGDRLRKGLSVAQVVCRTD